MHPMTEMKQSLKELSQKIRTLKTSRKLKNRNDRPLWDIELEIYHAKREFRHRHIAYCLVRGRTYEEIETPGEYNKPDMRKVEGIREELQSRVDAANAEWCAVHKQSHVENSVEVAA
jgi:hypothetical protein